MNKKIVNCPETIDGFRVINDGEEIAKALKNGETVMHWESGNSMFPLLKDMEYCKITPIEELYKTNISFSKSYLIGKPVFCHFLYHMGDGEYKDFYMVHRCTDFYERDGETFYRIEGTDGSQFGWTKDLMGVAESTNIFQDTSVLWN